ncbi:hypothetical protein RGUI_2490 [Rhodovulum sp. P5]|uniref:hypothetical protein n=1 Tax=Rhodovulum sp. P5 TaxID=1564506 RepID=UPI0009C3DB4E|nr:hypothetical protein [Rhodovulum sp. P5]ARE40631.1 hypothetical protein RGUI_2490 [Rhodovulum sp. P5]
MHLAAKSSLAVALIGLGLATAALAHTPLCANCQLAYSPSPNLSRPGGVLGAGPATMHCVKELSQDAVIWIKACDLK